MSEFTEYASGVEGLAGYNGELVDVAFDVELDNPSQVAFSFGNTAGDSNGAAMTIEQALQMLQALSDAIDVAQANRRQM